MFVARHRSLPMGVLVACGALIALLGSLSLVSLHPAEAQADAPSPLQTANAEAVTISLWHQLTGPRADVLQTVFDEFETQYPTITVQLEPKGGYGDIYDGVIEVLRTGSEGPNLVFGYPNGFADYARYDGIRFLDDLAAGKLSDFYTATLDYNRLKGYGGQLAGLPVGQSLEVMYYNGDLLNEQGESPPLSWSEFDSVCDDITTDKGGAVTCALLRTDASHLTALVGANGGSVLSSDEREARFDEPAGLAPVQAFQALLNDGQAELYDGFVNVPFAAGEAAFTFGSSSAMQFYEDSVQQEGIVSDWGIAPVPNDGVNDGIVVYGPNVAILQTTPDKEAAAWLAVQWLTQPDVNARFAAGAGYYPVRISASSHPSVTAKLAASPQYAQGYDLLPRGAHEPSPRGWEQARRIIQNALDTVYRQNAAVAPTMQQAADEVTQLLEETGAVAAEITPAGGMLTYTQSSGITAELDVPSGALSTTETLAFVPVADLPGTGFGFAMTPDLSFAKPVTLSIRYQDEDIAGMDESMLSLYLYDWKTGTWSEADPCGGYIRDPDNNLLQAGVCHFSDYLMADRPYRSFVPYISKLK